MNGLLILIPVALALGALGLAAFLWSLRSGQYDDLDGAAVRILIDDEPSTDRLEKHQGPAGVIVSTRSPGTKPS